MHILYTNIPHYLIPERERLGINEISKKKSITPLKKVILILHFNKMNNELQTPTSSFYFLVNSYCMPLVKSKKSSNYNKKNSYIIII